MSFACTVLHLMHVYSAFWQPYAQRRIWTYFQLKVRRVDYDRSGKGVDCYEGRIWFANLLVSVVVMEAVLCPPSQASKRLFAALVLRL